MERTYRVNDVVSSNFLRLPMSLLANPKYKQMSLEAKFIYSLLLNRLTLSQRNGWINENNEVYLIYTRQEASEVLNITYKKSIAAFKELIQNGLLYEQRQGLGAPNLLYVLKAELTDEDATDFSGSFDGVSQPEEPENDGDSQICQNGTSRHAKTAHQDVPKQHIKNCQKGTSRPAGSDTSGYAGSEYQEVPKPHTSKIDSSNTDPSYTEPIHIECKKIENSQSFHPSLQVSGSAGVPLADGQADEEHILRFLLRKCELQIYAPNVAQMLQQAIERLFYSESLKIGDARLPKAKIRSYLWLLDSEVLVSVMESLKKCEGRIVNPTAYLMSTIINAICEKESGYLISMPSEYIRQEEIYAPPEDYEEGGEDNDDLYAKGPGNAFGAAPPVWSSQ